MIAGISTGCGNDGTTSLESTTTSTAKSGPTVPQSKSIEALIETFKKLGFNETQTRCMVDHLEELSAEIGPKDTISADDQSRIEELMKSCGLS